MCIRINWWPTVKCDDCERTHVRWGVDITWKHEQTKYYWIPVRSCPFCRSDNTHRMTNQELKDFFDPSKVVGVREPSSEERLNG